MLADSVCSLLLLLLLCCRQKWRNAILKYDMAKNKTPIAEFRREVPPRVAFLGEKELNFPFFLTKKYLVHLEHTVTG